MKDMLLEQDIKNYFLYATREHIEECIVDKCLESEILMSHFHGSEIDPVDAADMLWCDLKPAVADRIIDEWINDNEVKFTELYNEWWSDQGRIEYEYREE